MTQDFKKGFFLRLLSALAGVLGMMTLLSCSGEPSPASERQQAFDTVFEEIKRPTSEWAATLAAEMQRRRQDGEIDVEAMRGLAERTGMPVADSICEAVKENDGVAQSQENGELARETLHDFVDREIMAAIAEYPVLLYDLKVEWPTSWLLDPSRQPDYTAPVAGLNSQYLKEFLRAEFVADDGSVMIPDRGSKGYENFLAWKDLSKGNTLAARASSLSRMVNAAIDDCVGNLSD